MSSPRASVVIVSQDRPRELRNCLSALRFQTVSNFEVIVVGDPSIETVLQDLALSEQVTFVKFNEANISKARNLGISHATAPIVAFIDDDAVAEPTWLAHLLEAFKTPDVAAAGGFVRGRNGISFQWKADTIDATGEAIPLEVTDQVILQNVSNRAIKTPGTNCAFRRKSLIELGGFDPGFQFYLDETDVNLRLCRAGYSTAIVPLAQVHHSYAKSARRQSNRAPRSLFNEGASKAYFLRKHAQDPDHFHAFARGQKTRLLRYMKHGDLEPRDVPRLMKTLHDGRDVGMKKVSIQAEIKKIDGVNPIFATADSISPACLFSHWRKRTSAFNKATELARSGQAVTVFLLSYTTLFHHRWFHENGFWVQSGGVFGKSDRDSGLFRRTTLARRVKDEWASLNGIRYMPPLSLEPIQL
ncbi:MAG: glycosyltransferase [Pseudomonadota bacterium]